MATRRWTVGRLRPVIALAAVALALELVFLIVVSRADFRTWLKGQLESGGGSASFGSIGGWPLRIRLTDLVFVPKVGTSNVKALKAPSAHATIEWWPLLRERRLALRGVTLSQAEVEARIDGGRVEQIALPLPVRDVRLRASTVRIANLSGWTATLSGVTTSLLQERTGRELRLAGSLRSERVALGTLVVQALKGDFRLSEGRLELLASEANLYGGNVRVQGALRLEPPQTLERFHLSVADADILPTLRALGYSQRFGGRAALEATCAGRLTPTVRALEGDGRVSVARFSAEADLPKLNLFNVAPALKELRRVEGLAGGFQLLLSGARVDVIELSLANRDLRITGSGSMTLNGALSVSCQSLLGPRLAKGVPGIVSSSLKHDAQGRLIVPFLLENSLADPKVDVGSVVAGAFVRPLKKIF